KVDRRRGGLPLRRRRPELLRLAAREELLQQHDELPAAVQTAGRADRLQGEVDLRVRGEKRREERRTSRPKGFDYETAGFLRGRRRSGALGSERGWPTQREAEAD